MKKGTGKAGPYSASISAGNAEPCQGTAKHLHALAKLKEGETPQGRSGPVRRFGKALFRCALDLHR